MAMGFDAGVGMIVPFINPVRMDDLSALRRQPAETTTKRKAATGVNNGLGQSMADFHHQLPGIFVHQKDSPLVSQAKSVSVQYQHQ